MDVPRREFILRLDATYFKKGQIIQDSQGRDLLILKSYPYNWWRKLLRWLGFKIRNYHYYKVHQLLNNKFRRLN